MLSGYSLTFIVSRGWPTIVDVIPAKVPAIKSYAKSFRIELLERLSASS